MIKVPAFVGAIILGIVGHVCMTTASLLPINILQAITALSLSVIVALLLFCKVKVGLLDKE